MLTFIIGLASRLRFPWLFAATAVLFLVSPVVPDPLPFVDELLLALLALLFGAWRKRKDAAPADQAGPG